MNKSTLTPLWYQQIRQLDSSQVLHPASTPELTPSLPLLTTGGSSVTDLTTTDNTVNNNDSSSVWENTAAAIEHAAQTVQQSASDQMIATTAAAEQAQLNQEELAQHTANTQQNIDHLHQVIHNYHYWNWTNVGFFIGGGSLLIGSSYLLWKWLHSSNSSIPSPTVPSAASESNPRSLTRKLLQVIVDHLKDKYQLD